MTSIMLSPKEIFEQEFKTGMHGYNKKEVDNFLDDIIRDYETYIAQVQELRAENKKLKTMLAEAQKKTSAQPQPSYVSSTHTTEQSYMGQSASNFDILKRISRLEKEVFGKQITE